MPKLAQSALSSLTSCAITCALASCAGNVSQPPMTTSGEGGAIMLSGRAPIPTIAAPLGVPALRSTEDRVSPLRHLKRKQLLYVTDSANNYVYVWTLPDGKLAEILKGFDQPVGDCVDAHSDVFVVSSQNSSVWEYRHGGRLPIQILSVSGYYPIDCSIDPTTGNLAVSSICSAPSCDEGSVAIYQNAQGNPSYYATPSLYQYDFCGYDSNGNLFVAGVTPGPSPVFGLIELPHGKSAFKNVTLNQEIKFAGGVKWDGQHLAIADQDASTVYEFAISGSSGTLVGSTPLNGVKDIADFWIQNGTLYGPDAANKNLGFFDYPVGGSPYMKLAGFNTPFGATVSLPR
jgi:WD40 repeat protein